MKIVRWLYGLLLALASVSCYKFTDFERPRMYVNRFNNDSEYLIVIGDTQEYTYDAALHSYLECTMQWIYSAIETGMNVNSVLHVGDITSENRKAEWRIFSRYVEPVAKIVPFVACIGNHDYEWNDKSEIESRNDTHFTRFLSFGKGKAHVLARYDNDRLENVVVSNKIFGEAYDILVLEYGARNSVIKWANDYVSSHSDRKFILLTHEFLTREGERISADSHAEKQLLNTSWSSPEQLWNELVKCNDNIMCVLCGHNGFSAVRYDKNDAGRDVPQILFNLQYQENGGNGMIEIWEVAPGSDSISVGVYNTLENQWVDAPNTTFKFRYRY